MMLATQFAIEIFKTETLESPNLVIGPIKTDHSGRLLPVAYCTVADGFQWKYIDVKNPRGGKTVVAKLKRLLPGIIVHDTDGESQFAYLLEAIWPAEKWLAGVDVGPAKTPETMAEKWAQIRPPDDDCTPADFLHSLDLVDGGNCTFAIVDGGFTILFADGSSVRVADHDGVVVNLVNPLGNQTPQ
jgi:hypothetical protein